MLLIRSWTEGLARPNQNKCGSKRQLELPILFLSLEPLLGSLTPISLQGVDWVIVGGESGPRARPMKEEWVTSLRDECVRKGVPFFFKQWGGVRKKQNGRRLEGKTWSEMPEEIERRVRRVKRAG